MADLSKMSPPALSAAMRGGTDGWGEWGNSSDHIRYADKIDTRRRCHCGCKGRQTHVGMCNGVALMGGCEFYVGRWVVDPMSVVRRIKVRT